MLPGTGPASNDQGPDEPSVQGSGEPDASSAHGNTAGAGSGAGTGSATATDTGSATAADTGSGTAADTGSATATDTGSGTAADTGSATATDTGSATATDTAVTDNGMDSNSGAIDHVEVNVPDVDAGPVSVAQVKGTVDDIRIVGSLPSSVKGAVLSRVRGDVQGHCTGAGDGGRPMEGSSNCRSDRPADRAGDALARSCHHAPG
ncbi:hypothetical protein [Streptomyces sp. NPDC048516]|uniref:hypothetical protein n=1 Tax=Streptomyces sp. NPDC048516 TaxID=3365565 RepID=UPI0037244F7F